MFALDARTESNGGPEGGPPELEKAEWNAEGQSQT
jgi:hypothetical protein